MKNTALSIILMSTVSLGFGQSLKNNAIKKWTPGSVGAGMYLNWDVYTNMSLDQMYDHASSADDIRMNLDGYEEHASKGVTGAGLAGNFSFYHNGNPNRELILGLGVISGRESVITYSKEETFSGDTLESQNITYCNMDNEWNLSAAYLFKKGNRFKVFTGIAMNVGGTFGKQMVLLFNKTRRTEDYSYYEREDWRDTEFYEADPSMYVRARIPLGMSYTFARKFELTASTQLGVGMQKVLGGKSYLMGHSGALMLGLRYHFKPLKIRTLDDQI